MTHQSLHDLIAERGPGEIEELSNQWLSEARHLDIDLLDFGTKLQDWEQVRDLVRSAIREPARSPSDPVLDELVLYLNMTLDPSWRMR